MKISLVQMNVIFEKNDENYEKAKELLDKNKQFGSDVIVFPETWSTGFFPIENLEKYAENNGEKIKKVFSSIARKRNVNIIAGSIIDEKNKELYNTSYIFDRKGENIAEYSKIHLFSPMRENEYFKSGDKLTTFRIDDVLCAVVICYDIRFLELIRTLSLDGIKILFVVAQWPLSRIEHWQLLLRTRAIENQIYVVAVNSVGKARNTEFGGNSMIINPWGEVVLQLGVTEEIGNAEIDLRELIEMRKKINIYRDRKIKYYDVRREYNEKKI